LFHLQQDLLTSVFLILYGMAASLYHSVKVAVLSYSDAESFRRGLKTLPWYAFFTWGTISGFMVLKGSPALGLDKLPLAYTLPCVVLLATLAAVAARFMLVPWLIRVIQRGEDIPWYQMHRTACLPTVAPEGEDGRELVSRSRGDDNEDGVAEEEEECDEGVRSGMSIAVARGDRRGGLDREEDIHEAREDAPAGAGKSGVGVGVLGKIVVDISDECDEKSVHLAECAVKHCSATERLYQVLQVSTCVFASISHGANDIANAVGPLASIWMVYSTGRVSSQAPVPWWILAYGAIGLDVGLMTYGHHIMRALGNKICYHSPSRGFCMDLGAMFTVLSLSKLGVPVSTTHCKSGATAAVGLVSSGRLEAVNWNMIAIILFGWVLTLPAAGLISGSLFYLLATTWGPRPVAGNGFFEFS
jgi:sodium-dependent phosphate transporter